MGTIIQISELKGLMINVNNDSIYNNSTITNVEDFLYNANVFPSFRTSMYDIITGLELAIQMNLSINTLTTENVRLSTFEHNVNTNSTFITQYINSKNLEILPFDVATIYDQDIMLQPWYAEYLFQYGPPSNGVFITEKLVDIVNGLISNGVITMNDFINS